MRKNWRLLATLPAALVLDFGSGQASGDEAPHRPTAPATARPPVPTVRVREHNGFQEVSLGGSGPSYLIDPRTETCALVGPGGSLLAVDCAKLARNLPQVRDVLTWLYDASPAARQVSDQELDSGIRCGAGKCILNRGLFDKLLTNGEQLATMARLVPSIRDGKPNGFKLYAIRPSSVFARLGLQNADLIKSINGMEVSTPDKVLEAYAKLAKSSELIFEIERSGENVTLTVQIR